ncbi:MAG: gfo/Idh/MocA family oxidoreductase [Candidatus Zixiibacteriota bacterium]|nr:MAG: gfo/Idh/MocA family oxidoreductase [candidate division Zixibacteria bacterium]
MKRAPNPYSTPRVGFLGVGWIGRHRMEALARSGRVEVAAIADPVEELVLKAREIAPRAELADGLAPLLDMDLDGLVIATPSALHAEQALAAFDAGLAVFCQKPLGRTAAETRMVIEAARRADRLLGVDLSYRFTRGMQAIRDRVRAGDLGRIYAVDLVFHNAYGPDKPWFYDPALSGGGCVVDLGIHLVDLALWTLDFPRIEAVTSRLYAGGEPLDGRRDRVEDYALARLDLETGAAVTLACSWKVSAGCDAVIQAAFYGTGGGLALRNVDGSFYDFRAEQYRWTAREILVEPPDDWGGRAAVDWAERLVRSREYDPDIERVLDTAQALDAIYQR